MIDPDTNLSRPNLDSSKVSADTDSRVYITAILKVADLDIDDGGGEVTYSNMGPVELFSPIVCESFTPDSAGHVSYFQQGPVGVEYI